MVSWMGRTALELIGQSGLGHSFDPLVSATKDEYTEAVKAFMCVFFLHMIAIMIGANSQHTPVHNQADDP